MWWSEPLSPALSVSPHSPQPLLCSRWGIIAQEVLTVLYGNESEQTKKRWKAIRLVGVFFLLKGSIILASGHLSSICIYAMSLCEYERGPGT